MRGRRIRAAAICAGVLLGCSCATPASRERPSWIGSAKQDDSLYTYRVGYASGRDSAEESRVAALANADALMLADLYGPPAGKAWGPELLPAGRVEVSDGIYARPARGGWECWVLVGYPLAGVQRHRDRARQGAEINRLWREAQAAASARDYDTAVARMAALEGIYRDPLLAELDLAAVRARRAEYAEQAALVRLGATLDRLWQEAQAAEARHDIGRVAELLQEWLRRYQPGTGAGVDAASVQLKLGDLKLRLNDTRAARRLFGEAAREAETPSGRAANARLRDLPAPSSEETLFDRWDGGPVAVACILREGSTVRPYDPLCRALEIRMGTAGPNVIREGLGELDPGLAGFAPTQAGAFLQAAKAAGARVAAGMVVTIDPAKSGQYERIAGVEMPLSDMTVEYWLYDVGSGQLLCSDKVMECAWKYTLERATERSATFLIRRWLEKCRAMP